MTSDAPQHGDQANRFKLGRMGHLVHVGADIHALNDWYARVFEPIFGSFQHGGDVVTTDVHGADIAYLTPEDRYASVMVISDLRLETMAPGTASPGRPIPKFFQRHGPRFHSVSYAVGEFEAFAAHLVEVGVELPGGVQPSPAARALWPHPRTTGGLLFEFVRHDNPGDPRAGADWSDVRRRWQQHPLGIEALAAVTFAVRDRELVTRRLEQVFDVERFHEQDEQTRMTSFIQIGQSVVGVVQLKSDQDVTDDQLYSAIFQVRSVPAAAAFLAANGIRSVEDGERLVAPPEHCLGARFEFCEQLPPNHPARSQG